MMHGMRQAAFIQPPAKFASSMTAFAHALRVLLIVR